MSDEHREFKKTQKQKEACKLMNDRKNHSIMLYGGSRSGKTFITLRNLGLRSVKYPGSRHLVLRYRFNHVKRSVWHDTFPKMMKMCMPGVQYRANKQDFFWEFSNGSQIWIGGLDDKERAEQILGNEYGTILFNECSQLAYESVEDAETRLAQNIDGMQIKSYYDCNPPSTRHWTYLRWIKKLNPLDMTPLTEAEGFASMIMNPTDNMENLGEAYIKRLARLSTRKRQRFLEGKFLDDTDGAMFKSNWLARDRIPHLRMLDMNMIDHITVAVDPAMSDTKQSDLHGIVVIGHGRNGHLYVLDDVSCKGTPRHWGKRVYQTYLKWEANVIVGEVNNGGDLVESNVKQFDENIKFEKVWASKGKQVRAEPVSTVSESARLHMVGHFPELEDEMVSWIPNIGLLSPNRMDALVWGCTNYIKPTKGVICSW